MEGFTSKVVESNKELTKKSDKLKSIGDCVLSDCDAICDVDVGIDSCSICSNKNNEED